MKNKILCCLIIVCAFFFIFDIPVYAETSVYDYADLLTPEEESALQYNSNQYDDISIIFLTTNDANGLSARTYANTFYDSHNFSDNGVLFLIDMDNREIYIDTVGTCIKALDKKIESILDVGYEHITKSDYYGTLESMFNASMHQLQYCRTGEQASSIIFDWNYILTPTEESIIFSALITIAILAIFIFIHNRNNKTIKATAYLKDNDGFVVNSSNVTYLGERRNVIHGYYNRSSSSSGGRSGGGRSHGGGGRRF